MEFDKLRLLVDDNTGRTPELYAALCEVGLPLIVSDASPSMSFVQHLRMFHEAAVLVASHGTGLSNAVWMKENSIVVEVVLRAGWCCFPIPPENRACPLEGKFTESCLKARSCEFPCQPYTMVDLIESIKASGVAWFYFDPTFVDQSTGDSARSTRRVHVNSKLLADVVLGAYDKVVLSKI